MKNIFLSIVLLLLVTAFAGCSKYLDKKPDDQLTIDMIFTDRIRTEDWRAGIYQSIPSPMWGYFKDQGWNIMGDDMTIPAPWQQFGWGNVYAYTVGNWNPTSGWHLYYWVELPKRIRSALILIENIKVQAEKNMYDALVERMKNEARFMMAYYYSLMLEVYGPIPFQPGVLVSNDAPA